MWRLPGIIWIGAFLICHFGSHAAAKENRYSAVFAKMEEEFGALEEVSDPVEIRHRHLEKMKATGNFSADPCQNFLEYSCGGHYKDVNTELPEIEHEQYHYEIFKLQMKYQMGRSNKPRYESTAVEKFNTFFSSCYDFDALQKPYDILNKFYSIIDDTADWTDAALALRMYGFNMFFDISYEKRIRIDTVPLPRVLESTLAIMQFLHDSQIQLQDVNEVLEMVSQIKDAVSHKGFSAVIWTSLRDLNETFPALHLHKFLGAYGATTEILDVQIMDQEYLENLNRFFLSAERSTINLFLKLIVFDQVYSIFENFIDSDTSRFDKCFDIAYKYLEPIFNKFYVMSSISDDIKLSLTDNIRRITQSFKTVIKSRRGWEIGRKLELLTEITLNTLDNSESHNQFIDSLYESFNPDPAKGFLDIYYELIFSYNKQQHLCLVNQTMYFNPLQSARSILYWYQKNTELCLGIYVKTIPLDRFSFPYYHIGYPDFWNYASLTWTYFWHVIKPVGESLAKQGYRPASRSPFQSKWKILSDAYVKKIADHGEEDLLGYEELKFTPQQAFFVALAQNMCYQVEGSLKWQFEYFPFDPFIGNLFKCTVN